MARIWLELKARNVIRNCTLYVAIAFGLLELVDIISGPMGLPNWSLTAVILLSLLGFPLAVTLSWLYMATPDGIRRYPKNKQVELSVEENLIPIEDGRFSGYSYMDGRIVFESDEPELTPSGKPVKKVTRIYGLSSLILIFLAVIFFLFFSGKSTPFQERDWVVLADFVNHTGEEIFDQSLNTAFGISINQSRHINVVSRNRMQEALKRIGQDAPTQINEKLSREIAMREGVRVYIVPEISRVGNQYILTGSIQETESGRVVASEIVYCEDQDGIINELDRMSKKMRRHLGESRYKISGQSKPLAQVTTESIEALKQFSQGIEYHHSMDFEKAVLHYRNAIGMDSSFTAAKASLGNILYERFDQEEGKKWLDEAIGSLDDLTEREKNGILAFYASNIEHDLDQAIRYTELNIEIYPDDVSCRNNLGWYHQNQENYREAEEHYKQAIAIEPYSMLPYGGLLWIYNQYTGEADSVILWAMKMQEYAPDNGWSYFYLGSGYFAKGDTVEAEKAFERCSGLLPGLPLNDFRLANTKRVMGKYEDGLMVLKNLLKVDPGATNAYYQMGLVYQLMGKVKEAESAYRHFADITKIWMEENPETPVSLYLHAKVLIQLGDREEGASIGEEAFRMDSSQHMEYAMLLAVQGDISQAVDQVELALESGYRDYCWIKMNPDLAELQDEPRFEELLEQYFD